MLVAGKQYRTVWMEGTDVCMVEQNLLPFEFRIYRSITCGETCHAIRTMVVRGAGAIGAAAGYAMAQACLEASDGNYLEEIQAAREMIEGTRPTARNLFYAVERVFRAGTGSRHEAATEAEKVANEDAEASLKIGLNGKSLIREGARIATHCNAGWLAFVDHGTALSPIYLSRDEGKKVFVYVGETRPRGQGARLTAWELGNAGIPHTIIPDGATAWFMAKGLIDLVIVGADRIAANGDVANKIGTLEKAIAAKHYGIPFYVAAPASTFDPGCPTGKDIIIEERDTEEVLFQEGLTPDGRKERILIAAPGSTALNPAFDITPAKLVTGIVTENGMMYM